MFQPPIGLLFNGSFEAVKLFYFIIHLKKNRLNLNYLIKSKIHGCEKNKWVMLNVQNQQDFACQVLNRDVFKDETVKEIIRANFIFVQVNEI